MAEDGRIHGEEERMFDTERKGTRFHSTFGNHMHANTI
jgi:hypothetical protein